MAAARGGAGEAIPLCTGTGLVWIAPAGAGDAAVPDARGLACPFCLLAHAASVLGDAAVARLAGAATTRVSVPLGAEPVCGTASGLPKSRAPPSRA